MKTLLLVSPPVLHGHGWWANRIANKPHLASLAGHVRDIARVVTVELDKVANDPLEPALARVTALLTPDVALVGLSCWTSMHYLGTLAVARHIRALRPELPIVIGGHHPTARPEDFPAEVCDWVVRHDGEHALRRLCTDWPARPARPAYPGTREVIEGGTFDQSDANHIDWDRYVDADEPWQRTLWVATSRGCAFKCRFCVEPDRGARYSRYTVEAQIDILERLVHLHSPRVIAFADPLFGGNHRWLAAFLDRLERRALPLMFWCETRADLMSPELLDGFRRNDFMVDFGLDSASATMIKTMGKATQPETYLERARDTFGHANRIGLHHGIYIIFNFPGETPETTRETQRWLESLGDGGGPMAGWLSCQTFFILPGTDSYTRLPEHAATHGTTIAHPTWWTEPGDHYRLATASVPSAAWRGREHELQAFRAWNEQINARWSARYTPEVMQFRQRFYLG